MYCRYELRYKVGIKNDCREAETLTKMQSRRILCAIFFCCEYDKERSVAQKQIFLVQVQDLYQR
jgi:hypothetical protein